MKAKALILPKELKNHKIFFGCEQIRGYHFDEILCHKDIKKYVITSILKPSIVCNKGKIIFFNFKKEMNWKERYHRGVK